MLNEVYNRRILELAGNIPRLGRLADAHATATAHSRLCGSTVTVDLKMDGDQVTDFAHDVKACALGQASSSIMARNVVGAKAQELRELRRSLADPLMDVLHRVLATTGLEVELSASPHALAARRRETLGNVPDVAASFAALDGEAGLLAFLAFLRTAAQYEKGLDNALPGGENTVKVLTAHKAKDAETVDWSTLTDEKMTVVVYMGMTAAPSVRVGLLAAGRSPQTPVGVFARVTRTDAQAAVGTLDQLPALVEQIAGGPAILIIGDVVAHAAPWRHPNLNHVITQLLEAAE